MVLPLPGAGKRDDEQWAGAGDREEDQSSVLTTLRLRCPFDIKGKLSN